MENCDGCSKLRSQNFTIESLLKHRDELESEVETLQIQIEALHTQISDLRRQIPKPKPNVLGAGRKPKVTPQIIKAVLMLREDKLSFGDIANTINEVSDIKISRSTAYEIYDKYGREQSSFSLDKTPPEADKTSIME